MKKIADKFITNVWLIAIIMLKDIYDIIKDIIQSLKNATTMNIDYFEIVTKLFMATALMYVFRQYYAMKRYNKLTQLFNQVMFEDFNRLHTVGGYDRDKAIAKTKDRLLAKAVNEFGDELRLPEIKKMVNDYFEYKSDNINTPL